MYPAYVQTICHRVLCPHSKVRLLAPNQFSSNFVHSLRSPERSTSKFTLNVMSQKSSSKSDFGFFRFHAICRGSSHRNTTRHTDRASSTSFPICSIYLAIRALSVQRFNYTFHFAIGYVL